MVMPVLPTPECPPDAHKVLRPAENAMLAQLAVRITDTDLADGTADLKAVLRQFSPQPALLCTDGIWQSLTANAGDTAFGRVTVSGDKARIIAADGTQSELLPFTEYAFADQAYAGFIGRLSAPCLLCFDTLSMFIMRSLTTIYPWDKALAEHFLQQYLKAAPAVSADDQKLLRDFRYNRLDPYENKDKSPTAYTFLRLERKLFLQYPVPED